MSELIDVHTTSRSSDLTGTAITGKKFCGAYTRWRSAPSHR